VCTDCIAVFERDLESNSSSDANHVERMIDLYDRALLLLNYSSQFIDEIADRLEDSTERHNKVGVGSSSVGLVSGALGVVAACVVFTPAGPPLLIAALVFGGSATAVQTGSDAMKYFSEPNRIADRIIALHGMLESVLNTTTHFRDATLLPFLNNALVKRPNFNTEGNRTRNEKKVKLGMRVGVQVTNGLMKESAVGARFFSRATTTVGRTARFVRVAGGVLSAATMVLEARELKNTIQQIKAGNPCEKAELLRKIKAELDGFPATSIVDGMCQSYLKVMERNKKENPENDDSATEESFEENDLELINDVVTSLEAQEDPERLKLSKSEPMPHINLPNLLERIQEYKKRQEVAQTEINLMA